MSELNEQQQNPAMLPEHQRRDWESEIRAAFAEALTSPDPVVQALAEEVLKMDVLNEFCFVISPKIVKRLLESENPALRDIVYRLWSSKEEGHVCVLALDKQRKKIFVVEAAGLLNNGEENDSSLGVHELDTDAAYKLFGNVERQQFVSPEYSDTAQVSELPQTEEEMNSSPMIKLSTLVT